MPRASTYLLEGYTYHLTHRCHAGEFFLKSRHDRQAYREWLREGVARFRVPVYAYCITRNHVHVVVHATNRAAVSDLMHLASGSLARQYNARSERHGSLWEHPYHCTAIQNGRHLLNCLRYVDLNMVRAGVVRHPRDWPACGYDELTGRRRRYRILDVERLAACVGIGGVTDFHAWYRDSIEERLAAGRLEREGHWTESLGVGGQSFVQALAAEYRNRSRFCTAETQDGAWCVREERAAYSTRTAP